jgi:hypothetical protein
VRRVVLALALGAAALGRPPAGTPSATSNARPGIVPNAARRGVAPAWWRADRPVTRWAAALPRVAAAARWAPVRPGIEVAELALAAGPGDAAGSGGGALALRHPPQTAWATLRAGAIPVRVVLVRLDPRALRIRFATTERPDRRGGPWRADSARADAAVALNAGQFTDDGPWGWLVHRGQERQAPGTGVLAGALVVDTAGRARVVGADSVVALSAAARAGDRRIALAVQSYPTLLDGDGVVPAALRPDAHAAGAPAPVDLAHRDARLAVGELRDGRLLVALTRFDPPVGALPAGAALAPALARVPVGLTVPEAAALLGALGARRALLLDGGLSAQLLVRDAAGGERRWPGLRAVPLGLIAVPRGA